uniref:Multifunctional fusion protein n=1 Tax=Loxodonta africana TaxID=9785 RepID=G3U7A1_LOXAF
SFPHPCTTAPSSPLLPSTAEPAEEDSDLRCLCVSTTSTVHPKHVISLEVIKAGLHCPKAQLIATLKNGRKICLDQQARLYKKIIKKLLLEGEEN